MRACCLVLFFLLCAFTPLGVSGIIDVHIIAHSHCDPGWLETIEVYYRQQVHSILDNVLAELRRNQDRYFNWSETAFFKLWWDGLDESRREVVRQLVADGKIEFVGAGWVQHDEASPTLAARVYEETEGHEWLLRTFGVRPRVAWQIDPFGHSSLSPDLFAEMGFWALVINRIPFNMKDGLKASRGMEFHWNPTSTGSGLFTHVLHTHYSAPRGFDWEEPTDALAVNDGTISSVAAQFATEIKMRASSYRTSQLLVPFGDDFKFQKAETQFGNMDRLIHEVNRRADALGVRMRYSTLSSYFRAVSTAARESAITFPRYKGDFFPYADNAESFWTGYFTSRPTLKGVARMAESAVRAAEMLMVFARSYADASGATVAKGGFGFLFKQLQVARRGASLAQHHDGLTGTSKAGVVADYLTKLDAAIAAADEVAAAMQSFLLSSQWNRQPKAPGSAAEVTELLDGSQRTALLLHNTLGWERKEVVQVMVTSADVAVYDPDGKPLGAAAQVRPAWHWDSNAGVLQASTTSFQVSFAAVVPALGMAVYIVDPSPSSPEHAAKPAELTVYEKCQNKIRGARGEGGVVYRGMDGPIVLQSDSISLELSSVNGLPKSVTSKATQVSTEISQSFLVYHTQTSGAYIFRSAGDAQPLSAGCLTVGVSRGSVSEDALIKVSGGVGVKATLDRTQAHVDLDVSVTPGSNQEVITRFSTQIQNPKGRFFVDNAVRMIQRQRSPTIPASYYPMVHQARIEDPTHQLTVISSQALGASSLATGQLEVMLHRSLVQDDGRGMGEGLVDTSTANVMLRIVTNDGADGLKSTRLSLEINNLLSAAARQVTFHAPSISEFRNTVLTRWQPLKAELPPELHLLSLAPRDATTSTVVLQFHRIPTAGPSRVNLLELFTDFELSHLQERTLSLHSHPTTRLHNPRFNWAPDGADWEALAFGPAAQARGKKGRAVSQNTNEEGVFISHAALQKTNPHPPQGPQPHPPGRALLAVATDWAVLKPQLSFLLTLTARPAVLQTIFSVKLADPIPVLIRLASRPPPPPTAAPTAAPPPTVVGFHPGKGGKGGKGVPRLKLPMEALLPLGRHRGRLSGDSIGGMAVFDQPAPAPARSNPPPLRRAPQPYLASGSSAVLVAAASEVVRLENDAAIAAQHATELERALGDENPVAPDLHPKHLVTTTPLPSRRLRAKKNSQRRYWWMTLFFLSVGPLMFIAVICYGVLYGRASMNSGKSARARN